MAIRVDPTVLPEMESFGAFDISACFNCGNCTAVCALSKDDTVFPRKFIRYVQVGARDKLIGSTEPWLCYYCGDCTDTCPRGAEPAEMMMSARRWLISIYDWTGLSRLMHKHEAWEYGMLAIVALIVLAFFTLPSNFGFRLLSQHPEALTVLDLGKFAPSEFVHWGDIIMALVLSFFLLTNAARMFYFVTRNGPKVPLQVYIIKFFDFVIHLLTQKRWSECEKNNVKHWIRHIFLVTGYGTMFLLVVIFLPWFQRDLGGEFHWTAIPGYYATLTLLGVTSWMLLDRLSKRDQIHKHSHLSDWLFPILLFLTALTGVMMNIFRMADLPMATYVIYVIHLMIAVPMLVVEVPFGKWAHLLYRPLAIYLVSVREEAEKLQAASAAEASKAA